MPHQFTFEQYASFNKLEKDAKAEDHASELKKMSEMDYESLFSKFGEDAIAAHTVVELKEELKKLELSTAGRKQELVERLAEHLRSSHKRKADDSTESDEKKQKVDFEGKNPGNVIGGYKAAAHNPNLPEESREKAEQVLESMGVDPNEKAESTAKLSDGSIEGKNPGNVAGGFKATLHNENASEEAKEHAQEMLDKMGVDAEEKAPRKDDDKPKDEAHVIAGYKATLSNEAASKEAKDHARKVLEEMGVDPEERLSSKPDYSTTEVDLSGKDETHVIAGYKATLSNEAASKEAKDHARKVLEEMGVDPEERLSSKPDYSTTEVDLSGKDETHVIAGYKATLSNESASKEAKDHARKVLEEMGVDPEERLSSKPDYSTTEVDLSGKDETHVIAGYKATLSNEAASKEAKDHARKVLEEMGVNPDERVKTDYSSTEVNMEGKDRAHVIGGYKATLSNAEASDEAKAHARKVLEEMGVDPEERAADQSKSEYAGQVTADGRNLGNVVGGYKATLHNANASEEAKEGARAALEQIAKSQ
eukprot:TRINITY_DN10_c0_g1_i1.p1 TRINITY_DN10_c0_g1~~TRINITY_DN10_c0_g1_i1.p1  ORF type:complete len:536 (+),score=240.76 TRINITY_DN10_c0_g1_i1:227-1834(+)